MAAVDGQAGEYSQHVRHCPRSVIIRSTPVDLKLIQIAVDHGKSTLTDSLVQRAGIISAAKAGEAYDWPKILVCNRTITGF